jgi:hypothetical protein
MRFAPALRILAAAMALAALTQPAGAVVTYQFAGSVNAVPDALSGGGIAIGDPIHMSIVLGPSVPDVDPAASVGSYTGAIASWTLQLGSFVTSGIGGDVLVCDSPIPGQANCGSANPGYGWWSGIWVGKDGVRFVTKQLTSAPIVLKGYVQSCSGTSASCGNANVYDDSATALTGTGIPPALDPVAFDSSTNNGRVGFAPGFVGFSVAVVPEPASSALMVVGLGALGFAARRRRT